MYLFKCICGSELFQFGDALYARLLNAFAILKMRRRGQFVLINCHRIHLLSPWSFHYRSIGVIPANDGYNSKFARYCGIATGRVIVLAQVLGAALAGLGGAAFMLGNFYRFTWKALPNYGFDGFIVAIMARNQPLLVPFVALFLGYLRVGAMEMARLSDVPNEVIYIIQAVMILIVGGQAFLARWRHRRMQQRLSEKGGATHV